MAPNGAFVFTGDDAQNILLIGGGVGITPLMSVARYLTDTQWSGEVRMLLSFRKHSDYIFRQELASLQARNPRLKVMATMSDSQEEPWTGLTRRIDRSFLEHK